MQLKLSRWMPGQYEVNKRTKILMEFKRLRFDEVVPVLGALLEAWEAYGTLGEKPTPQEISMAASRFVQNLSPEAVRNAFSVGVRNPRAVVDGVEGELADDDGPITTGERLYDVAEPGLVSFAMMHLRSLSDMGSEEGKDSVSRSTSSQERETPASPEDAPSTASDAGIAPSTAQETSTAEASSSSPA